MQVSKGDIAEIAVTKKIMECGYEVHIPWGNNTRHDILVEVDGDFKKVQVKTAREGEREGRIVADLCTTNPRNNDKKYYDEEEVDVYVLYYPDTEECFWIKFEDAPKKKVTLATEYKQMQKGIRVAEEYKLKKAL